MKILSFKSSFLNILLLFWTLLWDKADCTTTVSGTTSTQQSTTPLTTLTTKSPPPNVDNVTVVTQNETSITLKWNKIDNISSYILQCNNKVQNINKCINATLDKTSVKCTVKKLNPATRYNFTLITSLDNLNSSGYQFTAVTSPTNVKLKLMEHETGVTLMWDDINNVSQYILQINGNGHDVVEINATHQRTSVEHDVNLVPGTQYTFTVFTVYEGIKSSGYTAYFMMPPRNVAKVTVVTQNDTSITLTWKKVDNSTYILKYNGIDKKIKASSDGETVEYVVSPLTAATKYDFTLLTELNNITSSGFNFTFSTAPANVDSVDVVTQNETSITLTWKKANSSSTYILKYNDIEKDIDASSKGDLPVVEYVVSSLDAATRYDFTLLTELNNVTSSGFNFTALTAPPNVENVDVVTQTENSITLRWRKVNNISTYVLQYNGMTETPSSEGETVEHMVSSLDAATTYNFTLLTKLDNVTSSGLRFNASTAPGSVTNVTVVDQTENSVTLRWMKVDNVSSYILLNNNNGKYTTVNTPPAGNQDVTQQISDLNPGTKYSFTLISVFNSINSTAYMFTAVTVPESVTHVAVLTQNDSSITLRWDKFNMIPTYYLRYNDKQELINKSNEEASVEHVVSHLNAATRYTFTLVTVLERLESKPGYEFNNVTAPHSVRNVNVSTQTESSITLRWDNVDDISSYVLRYHNGSSEEEQKHIDASPQAVEYHVTNLTPGTKYHFTLVAVFEKVKSAELTFPAVTAPINVNSVTVVKQTETNITLMWNKVDNVSNYSLMYGDQTVNNRINETSLSVTHVVTSLAPGKMHSFTLFTVFETVKSIGHIFEAATVPLMVPVVNVTARSVSSVTLTWQRTDETWGYSVEHDGVKLPVTSSRSIINVVTHTIQHLKAGTKYEFKVITSFSGLNSTAYSVATVTTIDCSAVKWHITDSSIEGTVEGLFTNASATNQSQVHISPNGSNVSFNNLYPGATYEINLEYVDETTHESLPQCRHSLTILPSPLFNAHCKYWASGYSVYITWDKPLGVLTAVEVNIENKYSDVHENDEQHVIIPGFQPAKTYRVTLTPLSGTVRSSDPSVFLCNTDPRGVIAGSVFAVLLFGVLICAALFIFLKRPDIISRKKSFISGSRLSNAKSKSISVAEFPDHFYQLNLDDKRGFSEEYEALGPVGKDQPKISSVLPENKAKNRFTNVLPYDWCRVKLSTSNQTGTSDYINASYMPGYKSNRQYIATQGPLPSTINDFWRMVWEQKVKRIVMVTNCVEGRRTKCEQYWPADSNTCSYGELLVTMQSEQEEPSWTLREFKMKHRNTSEERTVRHFHFTAWPDHNVPECTEVLIQFRGLVRQHIEREGNKTPTVVHCSAGVGRTGTIIALDVLLQQVDREGAVGINAFVHQMRLNRPYMVQTESQYVFLHQCIMDYLKPKDKCDEAIYENADMIYVNATALRQLR